MNLIEIIFLSMALALGLTLVLALKTARTHSQAREELLHNEQSDDALTSSSAKAAEPRRE